MLPAMLFFLTDRATYWAMSGAVLIDELGDPVRFVREAHEVRSYLATRPDTTFQLRPEPYAVGVPYVAHLHQGEIPERAIFCGRVRQDSATGQVLCEPAHFELRVREL
jgi:hypothetical protein